MEEWNFNDSKEFMNTNTIKKREQILAMLVVPPD